MQTRTDKQHVIELLDRLDSGQFAAVVHLLEVMDDPISRATASAMPDDEPVTEEDRRRVLEGRRWFSGRGGNGISMEEVLADFNLKPADFPIDR